MMENHDWTPSFWGDVEVWRCRKCGSEKRVDGDKVTYCQGRPTLLTVYGSQVPVCVEGGE